MLGWDDAFFGLHDASFAHKTSDQLIVPLLVFACTERCMFRRVVSGDTARVASVDEQRPERHEPQGRRSGCEMSRALHTVLSTCPGSRRAESALQAGRFSAAGVDVH
jgi:hypothetical protein